MAIGCAEPRQEAATRHQFDRERATLPGVAVGSDALDARALVADAAFHFPDETRVLVRGLLRTEFARREALRLELSTDESELERALQRALEGIEGSLEADQTLEDWARDRYGRRFGEVRTSLRQRLQQNQLYQLVVRARAYRLGRVDLSMLVSGDEDQANQWADKLRLGADPGVMARESIDPGPYRNGRFPPMAVDLPEPLGAELDQLEPGGVIGPFRFEGDLAWRVVRLNRRLPAEPQIPPVSVLIEQLREQPISAVEARAWFESMLRRYTAAERLPAIQAPTSAFVSVER